MRAVERADAGLGSDDAFANFAGAATGGAHAGGCVGGSMWQVGGERLVGRAGPGLGPGDWAMRGDSVGAHEGGERAGGLWDDAAAERVGRRHCTGVGAAGTSDGVAVGAVTGGWGTCGVHRGLGMEGCGREGGWHYSSLGHTVGSARADAYGARRGAPGVGGVRVAAAELLRRQHPEKVVAGDGGVRGAGRSRKRQRGSNKERVRCLAMVGSQLLGGTERGQICVWDSATLALLHSVVIAGQPAVRQLARVGRSVWGCVGTDVLTWGDSSH